MIRRAISVTANESGMAALCNDGTLWYIEANAKWTEMPEIPQGPSAGDAGKLIRTNADLAEQNVELGSKLARIATIAANYAQAPNKQMNNIGSRIMKIIEGEVQ